MQQTKQSNGVGLALHRRGGEGEGGGSIAKQATGRRAKSSAATHPPPPCLHRIGRAHRWGRWRSEARRDPPLRGEWRAIRSDVALPPCVALFPTPTSPRAEWRKREGPGGKQGLGRGEVRVAAGCKGFPHIDRSAITPPLHSPCARHVRREGSNYLTQGKSAPCATTRRAVQDARVPLTSTAIAPNSDVHRALAAL